MQKLTARRVETAKPGKHEDGSGLRLIVRKSGSKAWVFRYTFNGKRREMGLGPFPIVPLAEARQMAADARRLCFDGIDPIQARQVKQAIRAVPTFLSAVAAYIRQHRHGWKTYHDKKRWAATMRTDVLQYIGSKRVDEIETADVLHPILTSDAWICRSCANGLFPCKLGSLPITTYVRLHTSRGCIQHKWK